MGLVGVRILEKRVMVPVKLLDLRVACLAVFYAMIVFACIPH